MKRTWITAVLFAAALATSACLCFPKRDEPDPSTRIGGPPEKKPQKKNPEPKPEPPKQPAPLPQSVVTAPLPKPDPETCGAFVVEGARMLWGMGVVTDVRDPGLARKIADARARKQIAVLLEYHVANIDRKEHPDPLTRPVIQWELTLKHLEIADRWVVALENAYFSIAVVELENCGLEKELAEKLWDRLVAEGLNSF